MRTSRQDLRRGLFQLAVTQGATSLLPKRGRSVTPTKRSTTTRNRVTGSGSIEVYTGSSRGRWAHTTSWFAGRCGLEAERSFPTRSALDVHGIGEFNPARVHLTAPRAFSKRAVGAVIHTADLDRADIEDREGFRVTRPVRSLVDVAAAGADSDQLGRAIEEARDIGLLTPRRLRERAEAVDLKAALRIEQALGRLGL